MPNARFWGGKSPPTAGAIADAFVPTDIPLCGRQHAGLVGGLDGRSSALGALAQLRVGPVLSLPADLGLDELSGDLITEGAGDRLQLRELGVMGKAIGVDLSPQFPGHLAQPNAKVIAEGSSALAHVRSPRQVEPQVPREPRTSDGKLTSEPLAVQTMSCAPAPTRP